MKIKDKIEKTKSTVYKLDTQVTGSKHKEVTSGDKKGQ